MATFPCKMCGEVLKSEVKLLLHFAKFHCEDSSDDDTNKIKIKVPVKKEPDSNSNEDEPAKKVTVKSRRRQAPRKLSSRFECIFCKRTFSKKCDLNYHIRSHTNERPYFCKYCDQCFSRPNYLTKHLKIHVGFTEDELKRHQCPDCGKWFRTLFRMKEHVVVHTGEKPYKCDQCGKQYTHGENLKRHNRIHTGERPYECSICEKGFNTPSTLKIHMRGHSLEKPYKCNKCDKSFRQQHHLTDHIKTHTVDRKFLFGCPDCNKHFMLSKSLKNHLQSGRCKAPKPSEEPLDD